MQTNNNETNFYSKTFLFSPAGKFETRLIKLPLSLWHLGPQVNTKLQSAGEKILPISFKKIMIRSKLKQCSARNKQTKQETQRYIFCVLFAFCLLLITNKQDWSGCNYFPFPNPPRFLFCVFFHLFLFFSPTLLISLEQNQRRQSELWWSGYIIVWIYPTTIYFLPFPFLVQLSL